jgi:tetratricopeptide (TPR) repeat protein
MKKTPAVRKKLQEIFETGAFERLKAFKKEDRWEKLSGDDRELLGTLFIMQGEKELKNGENKKFQDAFSLASRVAPNNPRVYYRQALAFAGSDQNASLLKQACHSLKAATNLNPGFYDAWFAWGVVLVKLGIFFQEAVYFDEALEKLLQAESLLSTTSTTRAQEFYYHLGLCYNHMGKMSGEPNDFYQACESFRKALSFGSCDTKFWCDFASALCDFATLINKPDLLFEGLEYYWKAIQRSSECQEAWTQLAYHFEKLFRATSQEAFFQMATDCFENGVQFEEKNGNFWLKWGHLLCQWGKSRRDITAVDEACIKLEEANQLDPENPKILSSLAEAKILIGTCDESIEELKKAEALIIRSLKIQPDQVTIWGLYGQCLYEMGRYFEDPTYLEKAIEKYYFALSLSEDNYLLWHGLAQSTFSLGDLKEDYKIIERSVRLFDRVIEMGGKIYPQYWDDWGVALMKLSYYTQDTKCLESAVDKFETALKISKRDYPSVGIDPEWLYHLGSALDSLGDETEKKEYFEKAISCLSQLLEVAPHFPNGELTVAIAKARLAELTNNIDLFKQAHQHFQNASEADPEWEHIYNEWGVTLIYWARLMHDPAHLDAYRDLLEHASQLLRYAALQGSLIAVYNLACSLALLNDIKGAMECLERAYYLEALPTVEDLLSDPWIESLLPCQEFKDFISKLEQHD